MVLRSSTPCSAQRVRLPFLGAEIHRSPCISLNIFISDGGFLTHSSTEKESPWACPGP